MSPAPASHAHPRSGGAWPRRAAWGVAIALLLATFSFYTHPDFMLDMANQLWACF
ncbi:hypothetical protein [Macromonas nakdongensis]|uniref:hypothetical protein n=1 Tax=Macromonas nakdongensis TaxID=1843082 RepID=UPI0012FE8B56|nr:hypothetical protein [Macromonas nakdongensis]